MNVNPTGQIMIRVTNPLGRVSSAMEYASLISKINK